MFKINRQHIQISLVLGCLGLLTNLYPIPLFGNVQLILGNIVIVISAILLGPWFALLTAVLCATGLFIAWGSWHVFILFGLEAIWLGYARRKDIYALYADIGYWLVIGMPLFYLYILLFSKQPESHISFITLKQGVNGLIYAALGSLIVTLFSSLWHLEGKVKDQKRRTFNAQLTYSFTLVLTISLLASTLIFNHQVIEKQQVRLQQSLQDSAAHLGLATEVFIDTHKKAIDNASRWLSLSQADFHRWQNRLAKLHQSYPGFITMLVTDADARIIAASPLSRLKPDDGKLENLSVKDRHYFQEAFFNQITYVSPVFLGRGFGNDPIVAVSAPIYQSENADQPVGVIEGSLNLKKFVDIDRVSTLHHHQQSMIIIDENSRVIYASEELEIPPLSQFTRTESGKRYKTNLDMLNLHDIENPNPEFVYATYTLNNGWQLYVVKPFSPLLKTLETQYLTTFAILILSLIITIILTRVISQRLTTPLSVLANKFAEKGYQDASDYSIDQESPREFLTLFQSLRQSKQQLISHQLELEEKVAIRTFELEKVNKKLQSLAERDELTGLYNRRYAEEKFRATQEFCHRIDEAMALAILDIDNFKDINDTYGHQGGDECLRVIASKMKRFFKRDTDVIARYGGEEFLLILPLCNVLMIEEHLNEFRRTIRQLQIDNPQGNTSMAVTVSIGAIVSNASYSDALETWFKEADLNLYKAKNQGRDRVIVSIPEPQRPG
ncbi:diguanylate cyclase [Shewanella sediminis HAW-EB3]|uniref:diguanylate cyclase n=1 Tax=Shewanella sediminis (strain HAW-EB3) TaxID=425104 RepID=A8FU93_SHESH|nr:diguanylate cyclase [Shewanella sediminis]ABV36416.1 diguanylate cyclase [Shewanella sediminis HAW-EB3]